MHISVILAHPDEQSFNHAMADVAVRTLKTRGCHVFFHDLYKENFNPVMPSREIPAGVSLPEDIETYCHEITRADGVIVIHPNWWGQPPAILKGWIDRVIRPGVAYEFLDGDKGEGVPRGLLKVKAALVINTSNTATERERRVFGDPLETLWKNCIFGLCGVTNFHRRVFNIVVSSTVTQRRKWLQEVRQTVNTIFR